MENKDIEMQQRQQVILELSDFILAHRSEIIERWSKAVHNEREIKAAERLSYNQLIDHLPKIFEEICYLLRQDNSKEFNSKEFNAKFESAARKHGVHRWE